MPAQSVPQQSGPHQPPPVTGNQSGQKNKLGLIIAAICTGLILPVLVSLVTVSFSASPGITVASAHTFLANYYSGIVDSSQRHAIYNEELTQNFKQFPGHSWPEVNQFFGEQKSVTVDAVTPVSGNSAEFQVRLTYYSRQGGGQYSEFINFWLACSGYYWARFPIGPSCPPTHLKIDDTERSTSTP